jgi:heme oxygenase
MSQRMPIMERLRTETRAAHTQVEALPFFTALAARELPLASYVGLLRALSTVYAAFEQALLQASHPLLGKVWDDSRRKLPLLHRDLVYFQPHELPEAPVAMLQAHLLAQQIRRRAYDDPVSLLGYLYVLEGSTSAACSCRRRSRRPSV